MAKKQVSFKVNGKDADVLVEPRELLVYTIRDQLRLTGTHIGCDTTHCGACTVDMNGRSVKSCTVLTVQTEGAEIITIEGLADMDAPGLHPIQECFMNDHGLQCGFCTPGMIMRAYRFLEDKPNPSEEEVKLGMVGNLCRCTGYQNIVKATLSAADKMKQPQG